MIIGMSIARKLALGFCLGPVILAIVGGITYRTTAQLVDADGSYAHTGEVLDHLQTLRAFLGTIDSAHRGYLITGDEAYLTLYRSAVAGVDKETNAVASLTVDNPHQQQRLVLLRPNLSAKLSDLAATAKLRHDQGMDAAVEVFRVGTSDRQAEVIRDTLNGMRDEERDLLQARQVKARQVAAFAFDTIIYGTLLSFVLLAVSGWLITRSITKPIRDALQMLASSASEILAGTSQQAAGTQQQAAAVTETVTTVDEIAQTSQQANERVKAVADASRRAVEVGNAGRKAVDDTVVVMNSVKAHAESIAESILGLAEQAQAIGEIIAAVNDIAEQTNLLALNAAIEASRAGDQGRGFNVVATEIKALADQSKKATAQIRQILGEIQKATNSAVIATEEGSKSVNEALRTVDQAGGTIAALTGTIAESAQAAVQISASVGQQSAGIGQIQEAMQSINQATIQNLAATQQAERAAHDLDLLSGKLKILLLGAA